jgi:imidazolonepropionase-like amidohydrolase
VADGVDEVRRLVPHPDGRRRLHQDRATGGITSVTDSWDEQQFTTEEIAVAVAEAKARRKTVAVHAEGVDGIRMALEADIHSLEHGWFIDEHSVDVMLKKGTWWVPTLALVPLSLEHRAKNTAWDKQQLASEDVKEREIHALMEKQIPLWKDAVKRGVKVAFGTDQSHRLLVGENLAEMRFMVDWLGMSPMQVLVSATSKAAECIGRGDVGLLEAGRLADVLVVEGDPLENIHPRRTRAPEAGHGAGAPNTSEDTHMFSQDLLDKAARAWTPPGPPRCARHRRKPPPDWCPAA